MPPALRIPSLDGYAGSQRGLAVWSPDGTRIAFSQVAPRPSVDTSGGIAMIAADGGDTVFVTTGGPYDNNPSWSPDGSLIVFDRTSNEALSVYTVRLDGTDLTRVVDGMDPAWQAVPSGDSTPSRRRRRTAARSTLASGTPCVTSRRRWQLWRQRALDVPRNEVDRCGGCPAPEDPAFRVLGLDTDGDGKIDASFGPLECRPFLPTSSACPTSTATVGLSSRSCKELEVPRTSCRSTLWWPATNPR